MTETIYEFRLPSRQGLLVSDKPPPGEAFDVRAIEVEYEYREIMRQATEEEKERVRNAGPLRYIGPAIIYP